MNKIMKKISSIKFPSVPKILNGLNVFNFNNDFKVFLFILIIIWFQNIFVTTLGLTWITLMICSINSMMAVDAISIYRRHIITETCKTIESATNELSGKLSEMKNSLEAKKAHQPSEPVKKEKGEVLQEF